MAEERERSRRVRDRLIKKGEKGIQIEGGGGHMGSRGSRATLYISLQRIGGGC